jgi:hypothetical protein
VITIPRSLFNNSGDTVRLLRPEGAVADEFDYDSSTPDLSLCRLDGLWVEACEPTPGTPNADTPAAPATSELAVPAARSSVDRVSTTEEPTLQAERSISTMAAPRHAIRLRSTNAGAPVYALAMPGSVYTGIWSGTATPSPSPPLVPSPRPASARAQVAPRPAARAPLAPIAGGLAILVGLGIVSYERLRLRGTPLSERVQRAAEDDELPDG